MDKPMDLFKYCQSTVSDAMVVLLFGKVGVLQPIVLNHNLICDLEIFESCE